jgi:hypothetical protein
MRKTGLILLSLLLGLGACGRSGEGDANSATRDSAGVKVVDNGERGAWGPDTGWRVSERPLVDIGAVQDDPAQQLDRVSDAHRFPDGRIAVANAGSGEIRLFDARGRHLATVGRKGRGPGEFETVSSIEALPGDSLLVYDRYAGRLSWFDKDGKYVRSFPVGVGMGGSVDYVGRLADGSFLLTLSAPFRGPPSEGLARDTITLLRRPWSGRADSLASFPGEEQAVMVRERTINRVSYPFMRRTLLAVDGDGFWVGPSDDYTLERRRPDGSVELILHRRHTAAPVKGPYLDSLRAMQRRAYGPEAERALDGIPAGETLPAYQRLLQDAEGYLWVESFGWPGENVSAWDVFDEAGKLLGTVRLPPRFRLTQVGKNFVVGVRQDEVDVEHVQVMTLSRQ